MTQEGIIIEYLQETNKQTNGRVVKWKLSTRNHVERVHNQLLIYACEGKEEKDLFQVGSRIHL